LGYFIVDAYRILWLCCWCSPRLGLLGPCVCCAMVCCSFVLVCPCPPCFWFLCCFGVSFLCFGGFVVGWCEESEKKREGGVVFVVCFSESIVVEDPRPRALVLWVRVLWVCACGVCSLCAVGGWCRC